MTTESPNTPKSDIEQILADAGYSLVDGAEAVLEALNKPIDQLRCSSYGVFPDGTKCPGCSDCKDN